MQRSSESVAALATALARAQIELVNPEKSQVASIALPGRANAERSFRYAPLASGLDIIRKTLGRHEIAVVQTTATDSANGMINLTTMLAHTSGEWIASDWPVCSVADLPAPRRMGAALTYARRYALFTLVGIAGEDDLDAPDLNDPERPATTGVAPSSAPAPQVQPVLSGARRSGKAAAAERPPTLEPTASAAKRDELLAALQALTGEPEAIAWAKASMKTKNLLVAADAEAVEAAFERKMAALHVPAAAVGEGQGALGPALPTIVRGSQESVPAESAVEAPARVDKSALSIPTPRRYRDKSHLRFVASSPCLICGRKPADPHHLRFMQPRGFGLKASDEFTVPLCRTHHRALHRVGDERAWWSETGIDPAKVARRMWRKTRLAARTVKRGKAISSGTKGDETPLSTPPTRVNGATIPDTSR